MDLAGIPEDGDIRKAMEGANIGPNDPVAMFKNAALSVAIGYWTGSTMQHYLRSFSLIEIKHKRGEVTLRITPLGRSAIYNWFRLKE